MAEPDDEVYYVPLEDQRVFGAGIKRKRVAFVPSGSTESTVTKTLASTTTKASNAGNKYLSIVFPGQTETPTPVPSLDPDVPVCPVCDLPLSTALPSTVHESSISHQACLPHSHPPSHLPRQHIGMKYLSSYGWDPDSRLGLGAEGGGIRAPIKGKEKHDTVGLGVDLFKDGRDRIGRTVSGVQGEEKKLNAKEVRNMEIERKKKDEKLQRQFYQSDDVARYLKELG